MTGPDEELRALLRRWEAPVPRASLDERVWKARRQSKTSVRKPWPWKWASLAAGLALAFGIAAFWPSGPHGVLATRMDAAGFLPVPNGAITVVTTGKQQ